jgi:hypothetical protein
MPSLPVIAKLVSELALIAASLNEFATALSLNSIKEDVDNHEKLRRNAIPRYIGKVSRSVVYKNTKPRPAIFPSTSGVLPMQNGVNDASKHKHSGQRVYTRKHVRNEPCTVRPR